MSISPTSSVPGILRAIITPPKYTAPETTVLSDDGNAKIQHLFTFENDPQGKPVMAHSRVLITTTNGSDRIHIHVEKDNQLVATINGKDYKLPLDADHKLHSLRIRAGGGNDHISTQPRVNIETHIDSGDGDDLITADGKVSTVMGGNGNDYIRIGRGNAVVYAGEGDDTLIAGADSCALYGGQGNDKLYAGYPIPGTSLRQVYLNGGQGNDELYAGSGKSVLNGGSGNDTLVGHRNTTLYTGAGQDEVISYDPKDTLFAKKGDAVQKRCEATLTSVKASEAGKKGFVAQGSPAFVSQVEDHLDQLRGSPAGQKMLTTMDALADKNGAPVTIKEATFLGGAYVYNNKHWGKTFDENNPYPPESGFIRNGVAGTPATAAEIAFNPTYWDTDFSITPLTVLFHEMAHAYNGATGTLIPAEQPVIGPDGQPVLIGGMPGSIGHREYQAVGLPSTGAPFDFDNDPQTPATNTNPAPFTENALRGEMGVPLRDRYKPEEPSRIA